MSNSFNTKKLNFIINIVYIFILLIILYALIKYVFVVIFPVLLAIFIANIAEPTVFTISKQTKIKRPICSFVTILFIIIILSGIIVSISLTLFSNIDYFLNKIPIIIEKANDCFIEIIKKSDKTVLEKAVEYGYNIFNRYALDLENSKLIDNALNFLTGFITVIPSLIFNILITFILSIFISSSLPQIKDFIKAKTNKSIQNLISNTKKCVINMLKIYFKSYTLIMLITFIELSVAFFVFEIKPAITLAFVISLVDILPVFGVGTVMIPWGIILILYKKVSKGILIFAIYAVITTIRQIIEPKIISQSIGLPAVVTLPIMFIGLKVFGVIGLFLLPMLVTIIYDLYKKGCFNFLLTNQIKKHNIKYTE